MFICRVYVCVGIVIKVLVHLGLDGFWIKNGNYDRKLWYTEVRFVDFVFFFFLVDQGITILDFCAKNVCVCSIWCSSLDNVETT